MAVKKIPYSLKYVYKIIIKKHENELKKKNGSINNER